MVGGSRGVVGVKGWRSVVGVKGWRSVVGGVEYGGMGKVCGRKDTLCAWRSGGVWERVRCVGREGWMLVVGGEVWAG